MTNNEFRKYAVMHKGISSNTFDQYTGAISDMTRAVIEERDMPFRESMYFHALLRTESFLSERLLTMKSLI